MIQVNLIPATLIDNSTLHSIMLTQVILETYNDELAVPAVPQRSKLSNERHGNDDEEPWCKKEKQVMTLVEQTGVNLDYYHKLNIEN
jgi:hypothetical protein